MRSAITVLVDGGRGAGIPVRLSGLVAAEAGHAPTRTVARHCEPSAATVLGSIRTFTTAVFLILCVCTMIPAGGESDQAFGI